MRTIVSSRCAGGEIRVVRARQGSPSFAALDPLPFSSLAPGYSVVASWVLLRLPEMLLIQSP